MPTIAVNSKLALFDMAKQILTISGGRGRGEVLICGKSGRTVEAFPSASDHAPGPPSGNHSRP
jgi:hypothetical protein